MEKSCDNYGHMVPNLGRAEQLKCPVGIQSFNFFSLSLSPIPPYHMQSTLSVIMIALHAYMPCHVRCIRHVQRDMYCHVALAWFWWICC